MNHKPLYILCTRYKHIEKLLSDYSEFKNNRQIKIILEGGITNPEEAQAFINFTWELPVDFDSFIKKYHGHSPDDLSDLYYELDVLLGDSIYSHLWYSSVWFKD